MAICWACRVCMRMMPRARARRLARCPGVKFGLSTLAAAGIGNLISDVVGISLGEVIEANVARFVEAPKLTAEQMELRATRLVKGSANVLGISLGCLIGMFPLLFMHDRKAVFFDDDEMDLFQVQFAPHGVSPQQFFELLKHGKWHEAAEGTVLIRQGEKLSSTFLLHTGGARGAASGQVACVYEGRCSASAADAKPAGGGESGGGGLLVPAAGGESRLRSMRTVAQRPTGGAPPDGAPAADADADGVLPNMARGSIIGGTALVEPELVGLPYPHTVTLSRKTKYLEWATEELQAAMREDKHLEAAVLNTLYRDLMHAKREQKKLTRRMSVADSQGDRAARLREYEVMLHAVLADGLLHPSERDLLSDFAAKHGITDAEHGRCLAAYGWSESEFEHGVKTNLAQMRGSAWREQATKRDRAAAAAAAGASGAGGAGGAGAGGTPAAGSGATTNFQKAVDRTFP